MRHDESLIQAQIVSALSLAGVWLFMVPNGELGKISQAAAGRAKACGLRAGISDLVLMSKDGRAHFLEVKTESGRLSESQERFRDLCLKKSWPYAVVRSVEEAVDICKVWSIL